MSTARGTGTGGTDPGERSAAEIEREVERSRARLTGTVEELRERVSPGQVAEQAMDWLRGSGGREFVGNLGAAMRDNPMPVLLVAAGIGWLALAGGRDGALRGRAASLRDDDASAPGSYPGGSYPGESYPPGTYAPGSDAGAGGAASGLRDAAGEAASRAGVTLQAATETGRRTMRRAGAALHDATEGAARLGARTSRQAERARHGIEEALDRQPLLLGAFGLALGAALGALLPRSEAEDRLMGESRERLAERAGALAGEAWDDARGKLEERGLTPERGAAALGDVARDLRETAGRGVDRAVGEDGPATPPEGGASSTGMPPSRSGPEGGGPV